MFVLVMLLVFAQPPKKGEPAKPRIDPFILKAVEPGANDSAIRKLQKERVRERAEALALIRDLIELGRFEATYYPEYIKLQSTLTENLSELMDQPGDKVKCYEMRVATCKEIEEFASVRTGLKNIDPPQTLALVRAARIDAEIDLLKLKDSLKDKK